METNTDFRVRCAVREVLRESKARRSVGATMPKTIALLH